MLQFKPFSHTRVPTRSRAGRPVINQAGGTGQARHDDAHHATKGLHSCHSVDAGKPAVPAFDRRQLLTIPALLSAALFLQRPAWGATTGICLLPHCHQHRKHNMYCWAVLHSNVLQTTVEMATCINLCVLCPQLINHLVRQARLSHLYSALIFDCAGDKALRDELLSAIKTNNDEDIEKALRALSEQNPTRAPAKSDKLFGKWKLLWASPNSEVAKATRRNPLPSYSEQLIGKPCAPAPLHLAMCLLICCVRKGPSIIFQLKLQKCSCTYCINA